MHQLTPQEIPSISGKHHLVHLQSLPVIPGDKLQGFSYHSLPNLQLSLSAPGIHPPYKLNTYKAIPSGLLHHPPHASPPIALLSSGFLTFFHWFIVSCLGYGAITLRAALLYVHQMRHCLQDQWS